jgi:hypothetical protein
MTRTFSRKKRTTTIAIVAAVLVLAGGGAAFAYWTSLGSGVGEATTGTSSPFTVTSLAPTGGPLSPGGPTETVAFTVVNPGSGTQRLTGVAVTVAASDGTAWTLVPGCSAADYTVGTPAITYGDLSTGASVSGTVTVTMNNLTTVQDACKNVVLPLYFLAN